MIYLGKIDYRSSLIEEKYYGIGLTFPEYKTLTAAAISIMMNEDEELSESVKTLCTGIVAIGSQLGGDVAKEEKEHD